MLELEHQVELALVAEPGASAVGADVAALAGGGALEGLAVAGELDAEALFDELLGGLARALSAYSRVRASPSAAVGALSARNRSLQMCSRPGDR
jgi:hypothetical protein